MIIWLSIVLALMLLLPTGAAIFVGVAFVILPLTLTTMLTVIVGLIQKK